MDKIINKIKINTILSAIIILIMSIPNSNNNFTNLILSRINDTGKVCSYIKKDNNLNKANRKVAYITIDDGPSIYTEEILEILNKYNAKATFFMIDNNMKKHPEKVRRVIQEGNSVGLHSVSHDINELYKDEDTAKTEFEINKETFYKITGEETKLIRLPYGSKPHTSSEVYNRLIDEGYNIWDWNIDTQDWKSTPDEIVQNVKIDSKNKNEIVVLMHERNQTVKALDEILNYLHSEGYELLSIEQEQPPQNFWIDDLCDD